VPESRAECIAVLTQSEHKPEARCQRTNVSKAVKSKRVAFLRLGNKPPKSPIPKVKAVQKKQATMIEQTKKLKSDSYYIVRPLIAVEKASELQANPPVRSTCSKDHTHRENKRQAENRLRINPS